MSNKTSKSSFATKLGLIMATAGSAVGLGNIWKFPYIAGENGGGAFLIIYLGCVLLFGVPLLMTEFIIGKRSGKSAFGAFRTLRGNSRWQWLSWSCLITALLITGFYFVVTGWCFHYLISALGHTFAGLDTLSFSEHFNAFVSDGSSTLAYAVLAVILTAAILWFDVSKGIERVSKILMPLLLLMMIVMVVHVLLLPGSLTGLKFFFHADFSKFSPQVVLAALGQCFFSLSIGVGAVITYGSYMPDNQRFVSSSLQVALLDTLVAILAGVIIFPAVFAFGVNPAEGPQLVFVVLPAIFEQMPFSWLSSIIFFALLCVAALTSTISLMEVAVAFLTEATAQRKKPLNRHSAVITVAALAFLLILLNVFVPGVFGWSDKLSANLLMPLNALATAVFVGWFVMRKERSLYTILIRYIIPIAILAIFLNGLGLFK